MYRKYVYALRFFNKSHSSSSLPSSSSAEDAFVSFSPLVFKPGSFLTFASPSMTLTPFSTSSSSVQSSLMSSMRYFPSRYRPSCCWPTTMSSFSAARRISSLRVVLPNSATMTLPVDEADDEADRTRKRSNEESIAEMITIYDDNVQ